MADLGFGCMRLPMVNKKEIDMELFTDMVDFAMSHGVNYFDTAYRYCGGKSEPALKTALVDRYPREKYILSTKLTNEFMKSEKEQEKCFSEQLKRLGQEDGYIDYYFLHNQGKVNYAVSKELHSFEFALKQKQAGYVKHIGISFHDTADVLDTILSEHPEIEVVLLQINYLDWENESIQSRECYETAVKYGKTVFVMEPLKGGTLLNVGEEVRNRLNESRPDYSLAKWAFGFVSGLPKVKYVLSGMNSMDVMHENIEIFGALKEMPLSKEDRAVLKECTALLQKSIMLPCTSCGYCMEECPKDIPIPKYLNLLQDKHNTNQVVYYYELSQGHGRAKDCIKCGLCEKHCPQHIDIRKELERVSKSFDFFKGWRN
ncbi:MAG: aldo/keto reductase [Lachnospiraceae bacterium]|nr:aldo/keto reductase [Lachnospiraceae bacterium]